MKNRLKELILPLCLFLAVAISIVFTILIWTTPSSFQRFTQNINKTSQSTSSDTDGEVTEKQKLTDVYLPINASYYGLDTRYQLMSTKVDIVSLLRKRLSKVKIQKITVKKYKNAADYLNFMNYHQSYTLNYASPVAFGLYKSKLGKQPQKYNANTFSRILIPVKKTGYVYFLSDHNFKVYRAKVKSLGVVDKIIDNSDIEKLAIDYKLVNNHLFKDFTQPIKIACGSYLLNQENTGLFVTRLMGSNTTLTTREQKKQTVYNDNAGQRMVVKKANGYVSYTNYDQTRSDKNVTIYNHLKQSFYKLASLEVSLDDVRYAEYNYQTKQVTYRSYINGFPLISADEYGTYHIIAGYQGNQRVDFSLYILQLPVPAAETAVTLPATADVMAALKATGLDMGKLEDMQVGYAVSQNKSNTDVIDLTPTYFVKYNNVWINYQDLLNTNKEG
ncbi:Two-component signal transduction system YycFG, regulatory protein YycH [Ligilactobacillus sp. WC1T17]|uniref:Two-component signal transduction system YycFG, regulatory protein YycH n=1 Tax=Ligilactobacillus ruminis TaxID=1623 RepID=A0ABY1A914_9LACO|nr:Two-component signal transduction system YycFG, regulatory protein YycH [Ligilactobacillus ruminis]